MASCSLLRSVFALLPLLYAGCAGRNYVNDSLPSPPAGPVSESTSFSSPDLTVPATLPGPTTTQTFCLWDKGPDEKDEENDNFKLPLQGRNIQAKATAIPNLRPGFDAKDAGSNRSSTSADRQVTTTSNLFLAPAWQAARYHADLSNWQGVGAGNRSGLDNGKDTEPDKKDSANGNGKKDEDKKEDKFKFLPKGWNFHAQTTIIADSDPDSVPYTPVPTAWARAQRSRGNDYRRSFSRRAVMAGCRVSRGFASVAGLRPE